MLPTSAAAGIVGDVGQDDRFAAAVAADRDGELDGVGSAIIPRGSFPSCPRHAWRCRAPDRRRPGGLPLRAVTRGQPVLGAVAVGETRHHRDVEDVAADLGLAID